MSPLEVHDPVVITVTMTVTNQRIFVPRCACSPSTSHEGRPRAGGRHAVTLTLD